MRDSTSAQGRVGCYSDNGDGQSFKTSIKNLLAQAKTSKNILIVGHSRKGYELLKNNFLRTNFASIRSRAISTYLESCYKSGPLWKSCFSKANAGIKYREYSYIHNALPISFNDDEVDFSKFLSFRLANTVLIKILSPYKMRTIHD